MMIKMILVFLTVTICIKLQSQEVPAEHIEEQFDNRTVEEDLDDDEMLQQLQSYVSHPMNLNIADEEEMNRLRILTPTQIENLVRYRLLLGRLINIYELQAIPGWDIELIRKLLPFVTVEENKIIDPEKIFERWKAASDNLLIRISKDYKSLMRFRRSYKSLLQCNVTIERDAGEKLFDFTSVHFFAKDLGLIKKIAIGDYVISMGQGLVMSQGMSLKKSANVLGIKKQNEILRPYSSSGEYNFHRGLASTLKWRSWQTTLFLSVRRLDANVEFDSASYNHVATSILTSGYHRTENEKANRKKLGQIAVGGNISFRSSRINIGLNAVHYRFSIPIQKEEKPYNVFAFSGDRLTNLSVHYDRSFVNSHLFGEFAVDEEGNAASINGLLVSLDRKLDCSFLYRRISPKYRSIYSGSFTENSTPVNENGLYGGCSFRLSSRWKFDGYLDVFRFPYLKYLVPGPSFGSELFSQITWAPSKQIEIYARFKSEDRMDALKKQFRYQFTWNISREVLIRERFESVLWIDKGASTRSGFLCLTDFQYRPFMRPFRFKGRFLAFETEGSEAKVYAYESDVLFSSSVPGYSGRGVYVQINFYSDLSQVVHILMKQKTNLEFWLSGSQTLYFQQPNLPASSFTTHAATVPKFTAQFIVSL